MWVTDPTKTGPKRARSKRDFDDPLESGEKKRKEKRRARDDSGGPSQKANDTKPRFKDQTPCNVAEGDESAATMTIEAAMSKDRKCLRRCNGGHRSKTECIATWQYESPLWRREEALDNEFNATPRSGVC